MLEAFRVPLLICDGYEADDIIGTVVRRAEKQGFKSYMVTPDKDFGQLIDENTFLYKPSRMGDGVEILGIPEIQARWGIQRPEQVVDVLALMGDSSDNIPGVPGIGEKTAMKLVGQYGTLENLLAHADELKGKLKDTLQQNSQIAQVSKRLATILCDAPCPVDLEALKVQPMDDAKVKELLVEFEFDSIGRRLFGEDFKAGRGFTAGEETPKPGKTPSTAATPELMLQEGGAVAQPSAPAAQLKNIGQIPHEYRIAATPSERAELVSLLQQQSAFAFKV